jgi:hypothetical protein
MDESSSKSGSFVPFARSGAEDEKTLFDDYCRDDAAGDVAPKSKGSIHDSE